MVEELRVCRLTPEGARDTGLPASRRQTSWCIVAPSAHQSVDDVAATHHAVDVERARVR
jgi:hypothetical protein